MLLKKEIPEGGAERSVVECCSAIKTNIAGDYELEIINVFFIVTSYIGTSFSFLNIASLGRVEGKKDPEDFPWIRTA
jgi:hypothetical protein